MATERSDLDIIALSGLRVWGKHGATEEERLTPQLFDIELQLFADLRKPYLTDDLSDTIDYEYVRRQVITTVNSSSYKLMERLARAILDVLFIDKRILKGVVTIAKPEKLKGTTASITISRTNSSDG